MFYVIPKYGLFYEHLILFGVFHLEKFPSYGDVTITVEELQILTYNRYSWPLRSDSPAVCHTYFESGHPLIMVISEEQ